jgi:hypothetical protein
LHANSCGWPLPATAMPASWARPLPLVQPQDVELPAAAFRAGDCLFAAQSPTETPRMTVKSRRTQLPV